jgi:prefoldin subunit 5
LQIFNEVNITTIYNNGEINNVNKITRRRYMDTYIENNSEKAEEERIVARIDELKNLVNEIHEELTELYERLEL